LICKVTKGTAHTVTVNSLIESNKQTNKLAGRGVGFEKGCEDGTAIRWPEREMEAGYRGSKSYYSVFRKDRQVNLLARG
jgi:hypothetical protein